LVVFTACGFPTYGGFDTGGAGSGGTAPSSSTASSSSSSSSGAWDGGPGVVFSDDFEADALSMLASDWKRVGGSQGDWIVIKDATQVLAQKGSTSSTPRYCYAGPVLTIPATVTAKVKITAAGSSGTGTAMVCVRFPSGGGTPYACLALEVGAGAQIKTGGSNGSDGPVWPTTVALGTWYDVKLSVDASGALTAYLDGTMLGVFMPTTAIASGVVALATQSSEAEFDDVVLADP
jgi:hypothetical protein